MKTVLITGASAGIGFECAKIFMENGWNVAATMRNPDACPDILMNENNPLALAGVLVLLAAIMVPVQLLELGEEIGWRGWLLGFQVEKYGEKLSNHAKSDNAAFSCFFVRVFFMLFYGRYYRYD